MTSSIYDNFYYLTFEKILNNIKDNSNIILILHNYFNPLDSFSHLIKKHNINIYIIILNEHIHDKLHEAIKEEEMETKIHLTSLSNFTENTNKIDINYIIMFHLYSLNYLNDLLSKFYYIINNNTLIYIYCSLSNESENKINFKNRIRDNIKKYINGNIGTLLSLQKTMITIQDLKYNINKLTVNKINNYIIYGDNIQYEIIVSKII